MIDQVVRACPKPTKQKVTKSQKEKVRNEVKERDGDWCLLCGRPGPGLHLHRIVYASQGGIYEEDNCVLLCIHHHNPVVHANKKKWQPLLLEYIKSGVILWRT